MPSPKTVCAFLTPCSPEDEQLAARFGLRTVPAADAIAAADCWTLRRDAAGALRLRAPRALASIEIEVDPRQGVLARRLATARRQQPLPRALGLHRRATPPSVCDATAGLGRDALVLARLGCRVVAFERIAPLCVLLADAAARAGLADRLQVRCAEATQSLLALTGADRPDVVYVDPIFEAAGRAQVKKEMQVCRLLAGEPEATGPLLEAAFAAARERVVVKRHRHLPPLRGAPSFSTPGARVRFDVYLVD